MMTCSSKVAALREALQAHAKAEEHYRRAESALALAVSMLALSREAVERATDAIKNEGPE